MDEPEDALDAAADGEDLEGASPASTPTESTSSSGTSSTASSSTPAEGSDNNPLQSASAGSSPASKPGKKGILTKFNIYLVMFIFVLLIAVGVIGATYIASKNSSGTTSISSQSLSSSTFAQLANSDATVGNANQVLNVQSSAIFAGKLLARQDLEVAGSLQVGGTVAINGLSVSGTSQFGQAQVNKDLAVAGNTSVQGSLTVAKGLQVNGGGTFSGSLSAPQITSSSLQLNGDLILTHHITIGGATPPHTNGSALGGGGTASTSGGDSSGSVNINTGNTPPAGCFLTINFINKFNSTPHVLLTPTGASAGKLDYYVTRSTTGFSICDATAPPSGDTFGFDYFVVD